MDRRTFISTTAAAALAVGASPRFAWAQAGSEDARLTALLDVFFNAQVDDSPEFATSLGMDKGPRAAMKSQLDDRSQAMKEHRLAEARQRLAQLKSVDRARLGASSKVDYDVVAYQLQTAVDGGSRFKFGSTGGRFGPYVLSQQTGAYQSVPDFLDNQHKIETQADADAYLKRLSAFAHALDQETVRARADTAHGVTPPDFVLQTTLDQLNAIRGVPGPDTILVRSYVKKTQGAGLAGNPQVAAEIVENEVFPALDRQIAVVKAMQAKASHDAGVWKLKDGEAYYAAALRASTTTTLSPAEVHQLGLDQVADITARIDLILKGQGMTQGTVAQRLTALNDDPRQLYPNTDEGRAALLTQLNSQIDAMYARLPRAFHRVPTAKVTVMRVPPFIQDGAANGYYQRAALDGSRPAHYFINLKDTHDWPKYGLPTLTYHEAVPGHHLQISLQQESTSIPMIRRAGVFFSAFSEGWALYAEQLASELGAYEGDPIGEAGFLQSFLFRAVRLVVDTGIHYKRWSRERATDYMVNATGFARPRTQREIDRYCVSPGQACSYKIGHTVWARVRDKAKAKLGAKFDIKDFHDAGLLTGAMPLTVLEGVIDDYIAARA